MSFDELLAQIRQRITTYHRSRRAETVRSDSALKEAAMLLLAARPADGDCPAPEDNQRLAAAYHALGWLYFCQHDAEPDDRNLRELALAIVLLTPLAHDLEAIPEQLRIPEPLRVVLGAHAEVAAQVDLATLMLGHPETTTDPARLHAGISLLTAALAAVPDDHPDRAALLSDLSIAHQVRFEHGGEDKHLDRAIELIEQAVAATLSGHPNRAASLSKLGYAYRVRFEHGGEIEDLKRAINAARKARALTPPDDSNRPGRLHTLSVLYWIRFEYGGNVADLDRAITAARKAVEASSDGHPDQATCLCGLGNAYRVRFEYRGVVKYLDRAIDLLEQAVSKSNDHPEQVKFLSNLGIAYQARFEHGGDVEDLVRAIDLLEYVLAAMPDGHRNQVKFLSNLGRAHRMRFEHGGKVEHLKRAIGLLEQAVEESNGHPGWAVILSNLGLAYMARFEHGGDVEDLGRAIGVFEQAVEKSNGHPDQAGFLSNLGIAYQARLDAGGLGVDRETLFAHAGRVASAVTALPVHRVRAGWAIGALAHAMNEHSLAVELLDATVALMPALAPRESGWEDQEHRIGDKYGLVGEAIAAHCAIDDPAGAVEVAELGRGVLLATQLESRTDLTDLDHSHPDLAARLRRVRELLNTSDASNTTPGELLTEVHDRVEDRKRWWAEHDQLLTQIRRHPSYDRFLLPPRLADLQPALADSAVIVVNAGHRRSDAIILTQAAEPVLVPLTESTRADVTFYADMLLDATYTAGGLGELRRRRVLPEVLAWLWDRIVRPILWHPIVRPILRAATPAGEGSLPRVCWLPIGLLGLFPLHAAGHRGNPGALDTIISSYTPTLRALGRTRTRQPVTTRRQLTVAMHHTPGWPDLRHTIAEAEGLRASHPDTSLLLDTTATTDRVLAALPDATWVHFACHAGVDFTAPSRSGLCLHDATLTLPQISRLQLTHAELAYLSACFTAHPGIQHADESLHPASAFQMAGFRHVIASLWPLDDAIAAATATAFYRHLPSAPTADHAATALHRAICDLRAEHPARPDLWAALIHSGP
ncbi:CHAT domain-containing protein [Nocardia abscessus]|uniref:CHAT domain-containing protein n=1 Tax=Nocardia abscessus TaxID=120957 RepID=UPI002454BC6A|nr:CHAT domain-containing protein [Nocardia abscessus]